MLDQEGSCRPLPCLQVPGVHEAPCEGVELQVGQIPIQGGLLLKMAQMPLSVISVTQASWMPLQFRGSFQQLVPRTSLRQYEAPESLTCMMPDSLNALLTPCTVFPSAASRHSPRIALSSSGISLQHAKQSAMRAPNLGRGADAHWLVPDAVWWWKKRPPGLNEQYRSSSTLVIWRGTCDAAELLTWLVRSIRTIDLPTNAAGTGATRQDGVPRCLRAWPGPAVARKGLQTHAS